MKTEPIRISSPIQSPPILISNNWGGTPWSRRQPADSFTVDPVFIRGKRWGQEFEPLRWFILTIIACTVPQLTIFFGVAAVIRLVLLGPEGAVALFFAGQCLIEVLLSAGSLQHVSLLSVTAALSALILIWSMRTLRWLPNLLLLVAPMLLLASVHNHGLSGKDADKFLLLTAQSITSAIMMAYLFQARSIRLQRLATAFVICTGGAEIGRA